MRIIDNFNLEDNNSYRVNAVCKRAYFPDREDDFLGIYKQYNSADIILLGGGYNIILSRSLYSEKFIILNGNFSDVKVEGNIMDIEAGADMRDVSIIAKNKGLSGIEVFYDIPSSLGGAVVMNAGASGEEIKDVLLRVRYLDLEDMIIKEVDRDEINFEYRNSFFQRNTNKIVLRAWLKLNPGNISEIGQKMEAIKAARWSKQPKEFPNAGSVFKRPPGRYVGPMIEELGLKGYCIGGAKVSEKHAGFIINHHNATGEDIVNLIEYVRNAVLNKFGVNLEIEQRII
jgi:UDP-N-acetylmuramate dehydrogenase